MKSNLIALFLFLFSVNLAAQDVEVTGTITTPINEAPQKRSKAPHFPKISRGIIKLLKVELSPTAQKNLALRAKHALSLEEQATAPIRTFKYPSKVALGMNNVPVLDQGMHGTCVTFAVTGGIDALLNKGDYVSQLCSLQLGNYLEKNAYYSSGWDGSFGRIVLNQTEMFGIINKEQEQNQGCGGLTSYPLNNINNPDSMMNVEEYNHLSENIEEKLNWYPILDPYQAFTNRMDTNKTLQDIKAALKNGHRVIFGTLLLDFDQGVVGAVGTHHIKNDSWVLTTEIARDVYLNPNFGGHEMIITGYDDEAIAVDDKGYEHRGLLTLRNSWGDKVGDQGDFYMSYEYFKLLVIEAYRLSEGSALI